MKELMTPENARFQTGDRIAIYGLHSTDPTFVFKATVDRMISSRVLVTEGGHTVHVKQCRHLVKKERRRYWIIVPTVESTCSVVRGIKPETKTVNGATYCRDYSRKDSWDLVREVIEVVEVKK